MRYDVITNCDQDKAVTLFNFLKAVRCSDLDGSNLSMTYIHAGRPPAKAYRIEVDSKNRYRYCYSLLKWDVLETPIELDKFMERTVKI